MADQQQIIDELIDYIDKAVLKHSVSNRHVAEVLYWLNEGLKKVSTDGLKDIFISKKQIDETNFLLRLLGGVEFSSGDDPYRITQEGEAFLKKLTLNGGLLDYDPTHKVWKLDGNLLITGSTTWNAVGDYTAPTLLDLLPYDPATLSKEGGRLSVIGGGGSIGGGNIMLNGTLYEAANGVITLPDLYQKTPNGTASQFLKADGSVDSNLYALAYGGDQNSIQYSSKSNYLRVIDRRNDTILPTSYDNYNISGLFHMSGMPSSNWWSGIHVKGWGEGYATWELVGPS